LPKTIEGVRVICGPPPVPVSAAAWVGGLALSVTVNEALKLFAEGGVNVVEMLHDAPGLSVTPQPLVNAKKVGLEPVRVTLEMFKVAVPGFDRTTTCVLLVLLIV